jgi:hypothetical protein
MRSINLKGFFHSKTKINLFFISLFASFITLTLIIIFTKTTSDPFIGFQLEEFPSGFIKGWFCCDVQGTLLLNNRPINSFYKRPDVNCVQNSGFTIFQKTIVQQNLSYNCGWKRNTIIFTQIDSVISVHPIQSVSNILIRRKPLSISITENKRSIIVLLPGLSKELTGGPLSILHFCNNMIKRGLNIKLKFLNEGELNKNNFKDWIKFYKDFENLVNMEIIDSKDIIKLSNHDVFMATIYYTAFTASNTQKLINNKPFIYFIQDLENMFFPGNSEWVEALDTYGLNYFPIYSTDSLFINMEKLGLSKENYYVALPAIPKGRSLVKKHNKRFLIYSRQQADRNAFELTIALLIKICEEGFLDDWEIFGLGSPRNFPDIPLCKNIVLKTISNEGESKYYELLKSGDVALSLMITPHTSLPPFDFVSNKIVCVTNNFYEKTSKYFKNISELFVVSNLNFESLIYSIKDAIVLSRNLDLRNRDVINWPDKWDDDRCYGNTLHKLIDSIIDND